MTPSHDLVHRAIDVLVGLAVVVKGGVHHDARMVSDLAAAVEAQDATGGELLF